VIGNFLKQHRGTPASLLCPGDVGVDIIHANNWTTPIQVVVLNSYPQEALVADQFGNRYTVTTLYAVNKIHTLPEEIRREIKRHENAIKHGRPYPHSFENTSNKQRKTSFSIKTTIYNLDAVDPETWRLVWIGKNPQAKAAVTEYLSKYYTPEHIDQRECAEKHGISSQSLRTNIKHLVNIGLIPGSYRHISRKEYIQFREAER
jgi:hypothetical protein